ASFAGHTHMDDFRLGGAPNARYAFTLITPALSPIYGQNPAFRTVVYDQAGGILDHTTYDLANLVEMATGADARPAWQAEYTFTRLWRLPRVDLESLDRLYSQINEIPAERERWRTIFAVSSPVFWPPISASGRAAQAVRAFRCATGNDRLADFRQCY